MQYKLIFALLGRLLFINRNGKVEKSQQGHQDAVTSIAWDSEGQSEALYQLVDFN